MIPFSARRGTFFTAAVARPSAAFHQDEGQRTMVEVMTRSDREELAKVVRLRAKVAKADTARRKAELLADVEAKLSALYQFEDEAWAEITKEAEQLVQEADARIAEICRQRGVPENFRPGLHLSWYGRGENASSQRRAELRKLAERQIDAAVANAKLVIDAKQAEVLTALIAGGLHSEEAHAFLESMPTAEQLMSPLVVGELQKLLKVYEEDE
jgi:hypothetical protein